MFANQIPANINVENDSLIQSVLKQISFYCKEGKSLMISVFDVKKNKFLFCNDSVKTILGYSSKEIIAGGWEFWYDKINPDEFGKIRNKINFLIEKPYTLKLPGVLSLTYHVEDIYNEYHFVRHELSLHKFKKNLIESSITFTTFHKRNKLSTFWAEKNKFRQTALHIYPSPKEKRKC